MAFHRGEIKKGIIRACSKLDAAERRFRKFPEAEVVPLAAHTSFVELATTVFPDKTGAGPLINPLYCYESFHLTTVGVENLARKTYEWLMSEKEKLDMDILSVSAGLSGERLSAIYLIRVYDSDRIPDPARLFAFLGEGAKESVPAVPSFPVVDEAPAPKVETVKEARDKGYQARIYNETSNSVPFLNALDYYIPDIDPSEYVSTVYRVSDIRRKTPTITSYERFTEIFENSISYLTSVEKNSYIEVIRGSIEKSVFDVTVDRYIDKNYIQPGILPVEDSHILKARLDNALFDLYLIQDLITQNPEVTDIVITSPDSVRFRLHGKMYLSDISFIDSKDYLRFVEGLSIRNRIDMSIPKQTFTDERDKDYILRFSVTAGYITSSGFPIVHIRKVSRKKMMDAELMAAGMFDEKIRNYLLDCGRKSRGIVFAGPPGSGKTTILNWALDSIYEDAAEILVIQENDELFSDKGGIMFEHVVLNPRPGERACTLGELGQLALVSGANVFVIGEAKRGQELCAAIDLSQCGTRTAITIHSPSASDTIERMADLALQGYADSYEMAKRMLKNFQTIVYMQNFKVQEIKEIIGYDENKKDMIYKCVYQRE